MEGLDVLYRHRFSAAEIKAKDAVWRVLYEEFLEHRIRPTDTVLEIACGYGEFIRIIRAGRKIAVDLNSDVASFLPPEVEFHLADAANLDFVAEGTVDVCFTSNFFEHLLSKAVMDAVLAETIRVLKPGGRLMALQPNLRYVPGRYWDFYDHHLPLTHLSCAEAFAKAGFEIQELIPKFLPYSTKSALPKHPVLVRAYLRLPLAWHFLGRQFFIVGRKPPR